MVVFPNWIREYIRHGKVRKSPGNFREAEAFRRAQGKVPEIRITRWCVSRTLRSLNRVEEALARQMELKEEFDASNETDGYVFEEIGECLLLLNRTEESRPYFAKAHEQLSQDPWLSEKEPARLARLEELS